MLEAILSAAPCRRTDRTALIRGELGVSFGELLATAGRLAATVSPEPGERVAIVAPNAPALAIALVATWRAGAVAVPLSSRLRRFELERSLGQAEPSLVVCAAELGHAAVSEVRELAVQCRTVRGWACLDESGEVSSRERLDARSAEASDPDLAAILYTSGSTGDPKGVLVPRELAARMGANAAALHAHVGGAPYAVAVPASHAFGLGCLLAAWHAEVPAAMVEVSTSLRPLTDVLRTRDAPVVCCSPALLARLGAGGAKVSLAGGLVAGSMCDPELLEQFDADGVRVLNLYGMSEVGAVTACRAEDPAGVRYNTVGRSLPEYEVRIDDGEVQVRSRLLPGAYHHRAWGGDELSADGWFRTGDLGELDENGNLALRGRAKDVVLVGGFNVFPAEVERFLATHPAIAQAAVVGVPHPALGETLAAFVVPAPGGELDPREVIRFARAGIAGYKVPYTVKIVAELPLLSSGKPDRLALQGQRAAVEARA